MTTFICLQCNYKFDSDTLKTPKRCPYCGKANCVRQEKSAEALVDEVSRLMEEG